MIIKSFASYHAIIHHFTKVRLFFQSSSIFTYFIKNQITQLYTSLLTLHTYHMFIITVVQGQHHHFIRENTTSF